MTVWFRALLIAASAWVSSAPAVAQQGATSTVVVAPGVGAAEVVRAKLQVTAIDTTTRVVTLSGPGGQTLTLDVPPEAKRFNEIKVGQWVNAAYYEAIALDIRKGTGGVRERVETTEVASAPANQPAGIHAQRKVQVTADVEAIDTKKNTVRVRGPKGNVLEAKARSPEQLKGLKVGDQVELTYIQGAALQLEPMATPAK